MSLNIRLTKLVNIITQLQSKKEDKEKKDELRIANKDKVKIDKVIVKQDKQNKSKSIVIPIKEFDLGDDTYNVSNVNVSDVANVSVPNDTISKEQPVAESENVTLPTPLKTSESDDVEFGNKSLDNLT